MKGLFFFCLLAGHLALTYIQKGKTEKKKKQDKKKRKKEEFSTDYPACHFDVASSPFKCHFGALMRRAIL